MKVLFLGDVVGRNARNLAQKKIAEFKIQLKLDAIIINVENAAGGFGVTPSICDDFFNAGADVLTTGNHIWDKREIISYISKSDRLLRPMNMIEGTPGLGMTIVKVKAGTIGVANVMTNLFMSRSDPVFDKVPLIIEQIRSRTCSDTGSKFFATLPPFFDRVRASALVRVLEYSSARALDSEQISVLSVGNFIVYI